MSGFLKRAVLSIIPRPVRLKFQRKTSPTESSCLSPVASVLPRPRPILNMERVNVRCVEEQDEAMSIAFVYEDMNLCLQRDKNEQLERSLNRIRSSILKKSKIIGKRSNKKLKQDQTQSGENHKDLLLVSLCNSFGKEVDLSSTNSEAWQFRSVLNVGSFKYSVHRNSPTVRNLSLPRCAVISCPVFPRVSFEFAEDAEYVWYRGCPADPSTIVKSTEEVEDDSQVLKKKRREDTSENSTNANEPSVSHWEKVSTEKVYVPSKMDDGFLLKLDCTPKSSSDIGVTAKCFLKNPVRSASTFPFEKRHSFTAKVTQPNSLRVVSYNILADLYADSDFARDVLFSYCPPDILHIDYREQLLLKEITGYNADLICLQETGKRLFENSLVPTLKSQGLEGLICYKHLQPEGEAIFYRTSKLRFIESHDIVLSEAFQADGQYDYLRKAVSNNEGMLKRITSRSSVVQVAVFEEIANPSRKICVANTHLYFHPRAGHVRLIQTAVITHHLEQLKKIYKEQNGCDNLAVIFCCDLNSTPGAGAFELVSTGSVAKYAADWYSSGKEEFCGGLAISHSLKLNRCYSSTKYTNYVSGFQGVLDYIFYDHQYLDVEQEVPLPEHADVIQHTALPSQVFPSDHLALVSDLKWKEQ
ncbi:2',5'-phosphodiesterase 12-like [Antedon mediterranea]|uniref:2',5'-phosphodiesterase 12-like n=1 Tax=Antedon mediterranea TaxID=105859 RepID=UPI003AF9265E